MEIIKIYRYLSDAATPHEKRAFEEWLKKSEKNQELFESYRNIYNVKLSDRYEFDTLEAFNRFNEVMNRGTVGKSLSAHQKERRNKKYSYRTWWKVAAALLLAFGLSLYLFTSNEFKFNDTSQGVVAGATFYTLPGEQKTFKLPDGSSVRLNADSELFIPEGYGKDFREVQLSGEAFFDIIPSAGISFEVLTSTARIEVLGTSFGVRAWKNREESIVALQSGRVSVRSNSDFIEESTVLEPGEISKIVLNKPPTPAKQVNLDQYIGWKDNRLVFENTPLSDVLVQLELHYNVAISIDDSSSLDEPVTAEYLDESLEEILEYTTITHGVIFEINQP
ncbi:MAG: FecR domain-containing protein [Balneolaceae bacterium]|nr:FecR domain-containing protein [Balneolaceae bacterium]